MTERASDRTVEQTWEGLRAPYGCVLADPPWDIDYQGTGKVPGLHYSTMSVEDVSALPVSLLAARDAVLWLWVTAPLNRQGVGVRVCRAWGFQVCGEFVWAKSGIGCGRIPRTCHEILLVARRGAGRLDGPLNIRSVQHWPSSGQSVKPGAASDLIESLSPGPYVELFARQPRLNWDSWGHGYEVGVA